MREAIALLVVPVSLALFWTFSFRRGPAAFLWLALAIVFAVLCDALAGSMVAHHDPFPGTLAAMGGLLVIPTICVLLHELFAMDENGGVHAWRKAHPTHGGKWQVRHEVTKDEVCVYITNGAERRVIGSADPIKDENHYLDLKISAQSAASTYNDLGVK